MVRMDGGSMNYCAFCGGWWTDGMGMFMERFWTLADSPL